MGSPLSPVVSSHFMEAFEHKALDIAPLKPSIFLQCVDDTFVIWQHRWDKLNEFLVFQNEVHSKICFTMEVEGLGQLPFLDVLVYHKADGTLGCHAYRKPTHTDLYLFI